jgi:hypothetical protein
MKRYWWPAAALAWWTAFGFLFFDFYPEVANLRSLPTRALAMADELGSPRPAIVSVGSPYGPGRAYMGRSDGIEDIVVAEPDPQQAYARTYPRLVLIMDPAYEPEVKNLLSDWRLERAAHPHLFLASSPEIAVDRPRRAIRGAKSEGSGRSREQRRRPRPASPAP